MITEVAFSFLLIAAVLCPVPTVYSSSHGEIDGTATTTSVHDGDTFYIDKKFNGSDKIRLADINAPELGQPGSYEARDYLNQFVNQKTVYLDIDDKYIFDYSGQGDRLICVVYVDYNSTCYINVNKALLEANLAEEKDYDNEFSPPTWTLYVLKESIPEYTLLLVQPIFVISTLIIAMIYSKWTARQEQRLQR